MTSNEQIICGCGSKIPTSLKCGGYQCDNFICPSCMIQTTTVPKCKKCAKLQVNPAFNPTTKDLVLSFISCTVFAIACAIGVRFIEKAILSFIPNSILPYFFLLSTPLLGWLIGLIIERTSKYKKNINLQLIAGFSVFCAHLIIWNGFQIWWIPLLSLAIGIYLSIIRVRP